MSDSRSEWQELSRRDCAAAIAWLAARLDALKQGKPAPDVPLPSSAESALGLVSRKFGLSEFEQGVLLLAAGSELDGSLAARIADLEPKSGRPTISLCFAVLPNPHWSAFTPGGALRRGRLIRLGEGQCLTNAPIAADEAVVHFLNGLPDLDERLAVYFKPLAAVPPTPTASEAAARLVAAWSQRTERGSFQKVCLQGNDGAAAAHVAAAAARALSFSAFQLDASALPLENAALRELAELWERDAVLHNLALVANLAEVSPPRQQQAAACFIDQLQCLVAVIGDHPGAARVVVEEPPLSERVEQWRKALGPLAAPLNGRLERMADQFRLSSSGIEAAARELALEDSSVLVDSAWRICRERARGGLEELARRIPARAGWQDLVLPEPQLEMLRALALQVRHRYRIFEQWGFANRPGRSPGVTALFSGPSGAGKTLAAEVLASELKLDLYRIDLSSTVSKYIGETEKNLKKIFDAAEASGAILLFDEADALFGKRSEVKDSHDRFANLEVSYLLQRMEAYRGLAILTSNLKSALDSAFLRRLRFHVQFPFPAPAERERIWQRAFPPETPTEGLDWEKLSRLAVAGGNIANIALDAAFRAAHENKAVAMRHVLAAARAECAKIEKPLAENEVRGWV